MQPKEPSGESIRPPPPTDDELDGGRTLARLAKLAALLKHTLEHEEIGQIQMPSMAVEMEQEAEEAYRIIQGALDKVGNPCSVEQLGDRARGVDVIPIPTSALNYKDYLRATDLRDRFERSLYMMDIFPPKESNLDGQGRPNCRLERKRRRERELAGLPPIEDEYDDDMLSEDDKEMKKLTIHRHEGYEEFSPGIQLTEGLDMSSSSTATGAAGLLQKQHAFELPELRPITKFELARRKKHLEESATISNILKGFDTALLQVGRVHKVVKGGTTQSMRALVVIGNRKGTAGYGEGKSETPHHAIERACRDAKRNLLHVDLYKNRTIYHRIRGEFVQTKVTLWPKPEGSGITGNNNYAAIFQLFGIRDIGAKQHGPRSLINSVKALFNALSKLETPESICASRGLPELPRPPPLKRKPNYRPL